MKRVVILLTVAAFIMAGVFSSCKKQEKGELKQEQKQEAFPQPGGTFQKKPQ